MDDYITCLLRWLETQPCCTPPELSQLRQEESAAMAALRETLSPTQRRLFLAYEAARNAEAAACEDAYARRAFVLAKELYR